MKFYVKLHFSKWWRSHVVYYQLSGSSTCFVQRSVTRIIFCIYCNIIYNKSINLKMNYVNSFLCILFFSFMLYICSYIYHVYSYNVCWKYIFEVRACTMLSNSLKFHTSCFIIHTKRVNIYYLFNVVFHFMDYINIWMTVFAQWY